MRVRPPAQPQGCGGWRSILRARPDRAYLPARRPPFRSRSLQVVARLSVSARPPRQHRCYLPTSEHGVSEVVRDFPSVVVACLEIAAARPRVRGRMDGLPRGATWVMCRIGVVSTREIALVFSTWVRIVKGFVEGLRLGADESAMMSLYIHDAWSCRISLSITHTARSLDFHPLAPRL